MMSIPAEKTTDLDTLDDALAHLKDLSDRLIADGKAGEVPTESIAELLHISARLFSAHTDKNGKTEWPVGRDALNATETVVLVTALLEAADINLFDLAIWYRRP